MRSMRFGAVCAAKVSRGIKPLAHSLFSDAACAAFVPSKFFKFTAGRWKYCADALGSDPVLFGATFPSTNTNSGHAATVQRKTLKM